MCPLNTPNPNPPQGYIRRVQQKREPANNPFKSNSDLYRFPADEGPYSMADWQRQVATFLQESGQTVCLRACAGVFLRVQ